MSHIAEHLDWITELPLVKTILNKKQDSKIIIFGGILRTIMENNATGKDHVIKYLTNGGDIDIVARRTDLHPMISKLFTTMRTRGPQFKYDDLEYNRKLQDLINKINMTERINILNIVHNYDNYFGRRFTKTKHFHAKITGIVVIDGRPLEINLDVTDYRGDDDKLKNLTYDFSTNMARAVWNNGWQVDSRCELSLEQIQEDIDARKYSIIGGANHIGTHRYFRMVQRGYWPQEKDIEIFISHVFNTHDMLNDKENAARVIKYVFKHPSILRKCLETKYIRSDFTYVMSFAGTDYFDKYFDLFDEKLLIDQHDVSRLMKHLTVEEFERIEKRADIEYITTQQYNHMVYRPIQTMEMLNHIMKKGQICTVHMPILAGKTHELFLRGLQDLKETLVPSSCMSEAIMDGNFETVEYLHSRFPTTLREMNQYTQFYFKEDTFNAKIATLLLAELDDKANLAYRLIRTYPLNSELVEVLNVSFKLDIFVVGMLITCGLSAMKKTADYYKVQNIVIQMSKILSENDKHTMIYMLRFLDDLDHDRSQHLSCAIPYDYKVKCGSC